MTCSTASWVTERDASPPPPSGHTSPLAKRWVRPELGKVRLSKLTAMHLDGMYSKMVENGNTPGHYPPGARPHVRFAGARCASGS